MNVLLRIKAWLSAKAKVAGDLSVNNLGLSLCCLIVLQEDLGVGRGVEGCGQQYEIFGNQ